MVVVRKKRPSVYMLRRREPRVPVTLVEVLNQNVMNEDRSAAAVREEGPSARIQFAGQKGTIIPFHNFFTRSSAFTRLTRLESTNHRIF